MKISTSTDRPSLSLAQQIQLRAAVVFNWLVVLHDEISDLRAEVKRRVPRQY